MLTATTNTGVTNKKTFYYGSTDATDNVKFLGIEDYWGNRRWWIDGCFYDNNRNMLIGKGNLTIKVMATLIMVKPLPVMAVAI